MTTDVLCPGVGILLRAWAGVDLLVDEGGDCWFVHCSERVGNAASIVGILLA